MPIVVAPQFQPWSEFLNWVMPHVRGCGVDLAIKEIRDATIRFCEESRVWQVEHVPLNIEAGKHTYLFSPPANTKVVRIERAWLGEDNFLESTTEAELTNRFGVWSARKGEPEYFFQEGLESVRLVPEPVAGESGALHIKASIRPSRSAPGVDITIWERYAEGIGAGALFALFSMPDKPWSSPNLAAHYQTVFDDAKAAALLQVARGFTRSRFQRVSGRRRFL